MGAEHSRPTDQRTARQRREGERTGSHDPLRSGHEAGPSGAGSSTEESKFLNKKNEHINKLRREIEPFIKDYNSDIAKKSFINRLDKGVTRHSKLTDEIQPYIKNMATKIREAAEKAGLTDKQQIEWHVKDAKQAGIRLLPGKPRLDNRGHLVSDNQPSAYTGQSEEHPQRDNFYSEYPPPAYQAQVPEYPGEQFPDHEVQDPLISNGPMPNYDPSQPGGYQPQNPNQG